MTNLKRKLDCVKPHWKNTQEDPAEFILVLLQQLCDEVVNYLMTTFGLDEAKATAISPMTSCFGSVTEETVQCNSCGYSKSPVRVRSSSLFPVQIVEDLKSAFEGFFSPEVITLFAFNFLLFL